VLPTDRLPGTNPPKSGGKLHVRDPGGVAAVWQSPFRVRPSGTGASSLSAADVVRWVLLALLAPPLFRHDVALVLVDGDKVVLGEARQGLRLGAALGPGEGRDDIEHGPRLRDAASDLIELAGPWHGAL